MRISRENLRCRQLFELFARHLPKGLDGGGHGGHGMGSLGHHVMAWGSMGPGEAAQDVVGQHGDVYGAIVHTQQADSGSNRMPWWRELKHEPELLSHKNKVSVKTLVKRVAAY